MSTDYEKVERHILGGDIHTSTASDLFGVAEEDVTPKQRRTARNINFGLFYGGGQHDHQDQTGTGHPKPAADEG
jgi:DNA polymerase I-like protein with 3'-5' exonuclease and polymerase domains